MCHKCDTENFPNPNLRELIVDARLDFFEDMANWWFDQCAGRDMDFDIAFEDYLQRLHAN